MLTKQTQSRPPEPVSPTGIMRTRGYAAVLRANSEHLHLTGSGAQTGMRRMRRSLPARGARGKIKVAPRSGGHALRREVVFVVAREYVDARRRHLDDARGER